MMAVTSVASRDVPMVVCWAERSVVSMVLPLVAGRDASTAGRSVVRSAAYSAALMDVSLAASMVV